MDKRYYVSQYLNVIELDKTALLFNGTNGCLDEVSKELGCHLRSSQRPDVFSFLSGDDVGFLEKRGHVTPLAPEIERQRFRELAAAIHKKQAERRSRANLMLLMSYNCNLACKYCYQQMHRTGKSHAVMSAELIDRIYEKHLTGMFPGFDPKNVDLSFYGGEPFLPANETVIRKALSYATRYGTSSSAITNATQVDAMSDIFGRGPGKVNSVQVSLDGNSDEHDASRIPVSGEKTFDKIIRNVRLLLNRETSVSLRINLDKRTLPSVANLLENLKTQKILGHPFVRLYAHPLHNNLAKVDETAFMEVSEFSTKMLELGVEMEHPVSLRANDMDYLFKLEKGLGLNTTSFCMQTLQRALIVDAFGDLYACFEEAGHPDFRVGSISKDDVQFFSLREKYMSRHVANMEECVKCSVALSCGGQCGVRCRAKTGDLFRPHCGELKATILEAVKYAYQKRQKQAGGAKSENIGAIPAVLA